MTKTDEYGADNPRPWDPNHPMLKSRGAPHETAGLMRFHRAGNTGSFIMKTFKIKSMALTKAFSKSMDEEQDAARAGRYIHDAVISRPRA